MEFSAEQIAQLLKGRIEGDSSVLVHNVTKIEEGEKGTLSFLANPKYEKYIYDSKASIIIVNEHFKPERPIKATLIFVKDAYRAFAQLLDIYNSISEKKSGISASVQIDKTAEIGDEVFIDAFTIIGAHTKIGNGCKIYGQCHIADHVEIGDGTVIYAGVKTYHHTKIGKHCVIHSGAVIGADGFGFAPNEENQYQKVSQIGNVIIEDHVEIGANTTIDRATLGSTIIRKGVKLDNLIQVAHNVEIGENTVIAAQTGISGSTKIGKNCLIGGQVGFVGHITIADEVKIQAQSGIPKSITQKGAVVQGSPAFDLKRYLRSYIHFRNFEKIVQRIDELENKQS